LDQNHRSLEIEVRTPQTQDFADSQTEAQANQHNGSKRLNQRVEYLPCILYLKDARTLLALADGSPAPEVQRQTDYYSCLGTFPQPGDPLLLGQKEHPGNDQDDGSTACPYHNCSTIYLSWDAASWHISQDLAMYVKRRNDEAEAEGCPVVKTAPLPAGAQSLNVIESVFGGMARGILHNSDYDSVAAAKDAIDRY
jgi:hypothetical protein